MCAIAALRARLHAPASVLLEHRSGKKNPELKDPHLQRVAKPAASLRAALALRVAVSTALKNAPCCGCVAATLRRSLRSGGRARRCLNRQPHDFPTRAAPSKVAHVRMLALHGSPNPSQSLVLFKAACVPTLTHRQAFASYPCGRCCGPTRAEQCHQQAVQGQRCEGNRRRARTRCWPCP